MAWLAIVFVAFLAFGGFISSPLALVIGFLLAGFGWLPQHFNPARRAKQLLAVAIVFLGFGIHLDTALAVTADALGLIVVSIVATLALALLFARLLKVDYTTAHLIGSGTAICGGSAIAAVGPAIRARSDQMALALAVVFILNSLALLIFPWVGHYFAMDQQTFGIWAAVAIHDTSSVVGAAEAYGDEALLVATTAKLARALWILPLVFISALVAARSSEKTGHTAWTLPWFILGFIGAAAVATFVPVGEPIYAGLFLLGKRLLVFCLFLVGLSLTLKRVRAAGFKPLLLASSLWLLIAGGSLAWLLK